MARASRSNSSRQSRSNGRRRSRTMSKSEAGRMGGLAPHRCRGRECSAKTLARGRGRVKARDEGWFETFFGENEY